MYTPTGEKPASSGSPPAGAFTPATIDQAYGINNAAIGDGTGVTIAIVDAYDNPKLVSRSSSLPLSQDASYLASDLHHFDMEYNLPEPAGFFTKVNQSGGTSYPGQDPGGPGPSSWEGEAALDVEWAHAIAPGAHILLVETSSDGNNLFTGAGWAGSNSGAQVVSMSWSGSETFDEASQDSQYFTSPSGHGVTFLASTGDNGATGGGSIGDGTGYPAYSPNVVAVGGTTLNVGSNGNYSSETGWSFSGGGISSYEAKPSYQSSITLGGSNRTNPDVSFDADTATGVAEYDSYDGASSGGPWFLVGGTSVSAPCWAGLIALADGLRAAQGLGSLDGPSQTLPTLYKLSASGFHDITSGNNGYAAGRGYDLVTGIGTPIANKLVPDLAGLWVSASTPANSATVNSPPTVFTLTFSAPITPSSLHAGSLKVNGIAANSVSLDSTDTIATFTYSTSPVTSQGAQSLSLASGAATQLDNSATTSMAYSSTFTYHVVTLSVTSTSPAVGGTIPLPASSFSFVVNFNEAIDPSFVSVGNLTLSQGTVTSTTVLAGNATVAYTITGLTAEGALTVNLPAGTLKDRTDSTSVTAFSGTYWLDNGTVALATPLTQVLPYASLIYDSGTSSVLLYAGDTDHYTLAADPGQTITVLVTPTSSTLAPTVQLRDPSGTVLGSAAATTTGQNALLQTIGTTTGGTYALTVSGQGSSIGNYTIQIYLNAALDVASEGIGTDSTAATAQSLTPSFIPLQTSLASASRAAVVGNVAPGVPGRFYSVNLAAGEMATIGLKNLSGSGDNLTLQDGSGNVLATATAGTPNLDELIGGFIAPTAGVYYVVVGGNATATYSLVAIRDAAFDSENNTTFATAQTLAGASGVLGEVAAFAPPPNSTDWYQITLTGSLNALSIATQTPLGGPNQVINSLKPTIQLYDGSDTLVAGGTLASDGRNQSILATGLTPGATYYIQLVPAGGTRGEYFLGVTPLQTVAITTNPTSLIARAGQSATFTAAASGSPTPTVQWQVSTDNGATYTPIPGATSSTYTIAATTVGQNGNLYEAVFTNAAASATTTTARLTIGTPPIALQPTTLPTDVLNNPYSQTFTASGGSGTGFTFTETGNLPMGLSLTPGGNLSGTPTTFGSFPITVTATDSSGATGSQAYTLTIISPVHLVLSAPASATAGHGFGFTVQAEDSANNPSNNFSGTVSFTTTDPQGKVPAPTAVTNGFGVFLGTLYTVAGGPWTITVTSGTLTATGLPITVSAGPATNLGFVTQPVAIPTGDVLAPVTVQVLDAYDNRITTDNSDAVTLGIASGPGPFAAGSLTTAIVQNGLATFGNLTLSVPGSYTLSAAVPLLYTGPNSTSFTVTPLQVVPSSFVGSPTGFSLAFNAPFLVNGTTPVLYGQGFGATAPPPSVIVTTDPGNLSDTAAYVEGSLIPDSATNSITFLPTNTAYRANTGSPILPDGIYTVILRSSAATNGFQARNSGGGFLDGLGSGSPGSGDFTARFTVNAAAAGDDVVWVPDTADGPGQALSAPGMNQAGGGYPIYLSSKNATVASVQVTLNYDPNLLTITGVSGAHFALLGSSTPGHAVLRYSGAALAAGPQTPIGFIIAQVPSGAAANPVPYKAIDLLHLSRLTLNGGNIKSTTGDGLHLVAYVGDADGNARYSSNDAVLITRVTLQTDSGFSAYPLIDPVIVADTDGAGFIPADAPLQVNEAGIGLTTTNLANPPIPAGTVIQIPARGVEATRNIPTVLHVGSNSMEIGAGEQRRRASRGQPRISSFAPPTNPLS